MEKKEQVEQAKQAKEINLKLMVKTVLNNKRDFARVLAIAFVVACGIILCVPRYYKCNVMLAPELSNMMGMGSELSTLMSAFGVNMNTGTYFDAIYPEFYPDLMQSRDFQTSLFNVRVKNLEGDIETDYYTYLKKYQKAPWWVYPKRWIGGIIKKFQKKEKEYSDGKGGLNPFALSREQSDIADIIGSKISCSVDAKNYMITISVEDQDKLICATLADTVRVKLQHYITQYRTNKARVDMEYYKALMEDAKKEYEEARKKYAKYSDANNEVILASLSTELEDKSNDMQLKFNTYSAMSAQYDAAKAKVQERTPAFTIVQGASIPVKPAGPKSMLFVLAVLFLTFTVTLLYKMRKELIELFNK